MAFGKIPRFSPSFSPREAWTSFKFLVRDGPDHEVVSRFEDRFARYIGAEHAVMVPSARYGFYLLLGALGVGEGDEVVVPALTYFAIPAMVPLHGARPVFADVGATTHVLDPQDFAAAITERTKVVVPTHLFGTPCDMDAINEIAHGAGVQVIEDCAQSTGASYKGKRVGGLGDHAYYTFGLTKNITTLSGAMITTNDPAVAEFARERVRSGDFTPKKKYATEAMTGLAMFLATHPLIYWATVHPAIVLGNKLGQDPIHERFGEAEKRYAELPSYYQSQGKARAVQAAVGMDQLDRIDALNGARVKNGRSLDHGLAHVGGLDVPSYPSGSEPIYMSFVVHHDQRDRLMEALRSRGVDTTIGYMSDNNTSGLFDEYRQDSRPCPNAADVHARLLHIPVHPNLGKKDIDHMVESIRAACLSLG